MKSLAELPLVPLLMCLRYLDTNSLFKINRTCKRMHDVINVNWNAMVVTKLHSVVLCKENDDDYEDDEEFQYGWQILAVFGVNTVKWVCYSDYVYANRDNQGKMLTPGAWLAERLANTRIMKFQIQNYMESSFVVDLLNNLRTTTIRVHEVQFDDMVYDWRNGDSWISVLRRFDVKSFHLPYNNTLGVCELMTKSFMEFLSTLDHFEHSENVDNYLELDPDNVYIPPTFYKFPRKFLFGEGLILSMESFRRAIDEWWFGRLVVDVWEFVLLQDISDVCEMGSALGKAYTYSNYTHGIIMTSPRGEKIYINIEGRDYIAGMPCLAWAVQRNYLPMRKEVEVRRK